MSGKDATAPPNESPAERNPGRYARPNNKFVGPHKGFNPGDYPTRGPFTIYGQRRVGGADGRWYGNLGQLAQKTPPAIGWAEFLAERFGAGNYRVHDAHGKRSFFFLDKQQTEAIMRRLDRERPGNDDGDDEPDDAQPNPGPEDTITRLVQQLDQLEQARTILRGEDPPAPPPESIGALIGKALASNPQVLAVLLSQLTPGAARPNPPPPPPRDIEAEVLARFIRQRGITAKQAIEVLAAASEGDDPQPANDNAAPQPANDNAAPGPGPLDGFFPQG